MNQGSLASYEAPLRSRFGSRTSGLEIKEQEVYLGDFPDDFPWDFIINGVERVIVSAYTVFRSVFTSQYSLTGIILAQK